MSTQPKILLYPVGNKIFGGVLIGKFLSLGAVEGRASFLDATLGIFSRTKYIYITGTKRYSTILLKINKENVV